MPFINTKMCSYMKCCKTRTSRLTPLITWILIAYYDFFVSNGLLKPSIYIGWVRVASLKGGIVCLQNS